MYVVKVGEYYVKSVEGRCGRVIEVTLSKEIMRNFSKDTANIIAKEINGEVIEMANQVTMCEEVTINE